MDKESIRDVVIGILGNAEEQSHYAPAKIWVCHCEQCRYVKNKRKNRKNKKKIKRMLNKKRRKENGVGIIHYWA